MKTNKSRRARRSCRRPTPRRLPATLLLLGLAGCPLVAGATQFSGNDWTVGLSAQISLMARVATADALSPNSGVDVRQAFFTLGAPDFGTVKLGPDGGISRNQDDLASTADFKSNSNVTAGAYYALTKSVTLSFELSQTRPEDFAGNTVRMNGASIGGFLFF